MNIYNIYKYNINTQQGGGGEGGIVRNHRDWDDLVRIFIPPSSVLLPVLIGKKGAIVYVY